MSKSMVSFCLLWVWLFTVSAQTPIFQGDPQPTLGTLLYRIDTGILTGPKIDLKLAIYLADQVVLEEVAHLEIGNETMILLAFAQQKELFSKLLRTSINAKEDYRFRVFNNGQLLEERPLLELAKESYIAALSSDQRPSAPEFWRQGNSRIVFGSKIEDFIQAEMQNAGLQYTLNLPTKKGPDSTLHMTTWVDDQWFASAEYKLDFTSLNIALFPSNPTAMRTLLDQEKEGHEVIFTFSSEGKLYEEITLNQLLEESLFLAMENYWETPSAMMPIRQTTANRIQQDVQEKTSPYIECLYDCDEAEMRCIIRCRTESCIDGCLEGTYYCYQECWELQDDDNDGILNGYDNCVNTPNSDQENCDGDHLGAACDPHDWKVHSDTGWSTWNLVGTANYCYSQLYGTIFLYYYDQMQCFRRTRTLQEKNCYNQQIVTTYFVETAKTRICALPRSAGFCPENTGACAFDLSFPCAL